MQCNATAGQAYTDTSLGISWRRAALNLTQTHPPSLGALTKRTRRQEHKKATNTTRPGEMSLNTQ